MLKHNPIISNGKALVVVNKYTVFEPDNPEKTPIGAFSYISEDNLNEEGHLKPYWANEGYTLVGTAEVTVTFLDKNTMVNSHIASLKKQKSKVLAEAQVAANQIEEQIQSLLALPAPPNKEATHI